MYNEIIKLALPICYSSVLSVIAMLINMKMIGNQDSLAYYIVGLFTSINYLIIALFESLRAFTVSCIAQYANENIPYFLNSLLLVVMFIFFGMGIIIKWLQYAFFHFFNIPIIAQSCFVKFSLLMVFGSLLGCFSYILMSFLFVHKRGGLVFYLSTISVVASVVFTWFFVNILHLGLYSLALAQIFNGVIFSSIFYFLIIFKGHFSIKYKIRREILTKIFKQYSKTGLPVLISYLMIFAGTFVFSMILSKQGAAAVSGFGVAYRLQILFILPAIAIGAATAIHYNDLIQKNSTQKAKKLKITGLSFSFLIYTVLSIFLYFIQSKWIHFFVNDVCISDQAIHYLHLVIPSYSFFSLFVTYIIFCEQTSKGMKGLIMNGLYFLSIFCLQTQMELFTAIAVINVVSGSLLLFYLLTTRKGESYVTIY